MTTNGHAATGIECPRCQTWVESPAALKAHLIEEHEMTITKADSESLRAFAGTLEHRRVSVRPSEALPPIPEPTPLSPAEMEGHVCECGKTIVCDLRISLAYEAHAKELQHIAAKLKDRTRRLMQPGALRKNKDWTTEDARKLLAEGLSYRKVGQILGAGGSTIARAVARGKS